MKNVTIDTPLVSGYYCLEGCLIELDDAEIYRTPKPKSCFPLRTIRSHCARTARAYAKQHNAIYCGITKIKYLP